MGTRAGRFFLGCSFDLTSLYTQLGDDVELTGLAQSLHKHAVPGSHPLVGTVPTFFLLIFLLNFLLFPQLFSCPMHTQVHKHICTPTPTHTLLILTSSPCCVDRLSRNYAPKKIARAGILVLGGYHFHMTPEVGVGSIGSYRYIRPKMAASEHAHGK